MNDNERQQFLSIASTGDTAALFRAISLHGGLSEFEVNELLEEGVANWSDEIVETVIEAVLQRNSALKVSAGLISFAIRTAKSCPNIFLSLLKADIDINQADDFGATPLMYAAGLGQMEFVTKLLNKNADPGRYDIYGRNALVWASEHGHFPIVDLLAPLCNTSSASRLDGIATLLDDISQDHVVVLQPDRFSQPPDEIWIVALPKSATIEQIEEELQYTSSRQQSRSCLIVKKKAHYPGGCRSNPLARSLGSYILNPGMTALLEQAPSRFDNSLAFCPHDLSTCRTRLCILSTDKDEADQLIGEMEGICSRKYLVEIISILTVEDGELIRYRSLERNNHGRVTCGNPL